MSRVWGRGVTWSLGSKPGSGFKVKAGSTGLLRYDIAWRGLKVHGLGGFRVRAPVVD